MRHLILAAVLLAPLAAQAQTPQQLQQQLDSATATTTRIMVGLSNQIASDQQQIAELQAQVKKLESEKAAAPKPDAAKGTK